MQKIIVNSSKNIERIVDLIHDQWFNINDIKLNNQVISIKFRKERNDKTEVVKNYWLEGFAKPSDFRV